MSRHRSPSGRQAHPGSPSPAPTFPGAPPRRDRSSAAPRHAATSAGLRNGLTAAAVTGGALALAVPTMTMASTSEAADRTATLALTSESVLEPVDTAVPEGAAVIVLASLQPVAEVAEPGDPGVEAADLLKAVGLAEVARQAEEERAAREAAARCDADLDGLGGVRPWVRDAAQFLSCLYEQPDLIGVAGRARRSDHPNGLAVDFMVRGEHGDRIAECALANQEALGITYVIWKQRVNYGEGWESMADRGSDTENHFDHVHVSFERSAPSGDAVAALCT